MSELGDSIREQAARGTSAERRRALCALADRADALEQERGDAVTRYHLEVANRRRVDTTSDAFRHDLTILREGLMERVGRYTPSDADLLAYVDALKVRIKRVQALLDSAPIIPVHAGGGNLVNRTAMVDAQALRAALG